MLYLLLAGARIDQLIERAEEHKQRVRERFAQRLNLAHGSDYGHSQRRWHATVVI